MDIPATLINHYILDTWIRIIMLCFINVHNCCMSIKNKNKLIGHKCISISNSNMSSDQGKWLEMALLKLPTASVFRHYTSCVLLGEWEQEIKNTLAWWECLWSCRYPESSLPTKVASSWCGKNVGMGRDLGFDEEENQPYWMLRLMCLNSWLTSEGFGFGSWWRFGDVGFTKKNFEGWTHVCFQLVLPASWSFTMTCSHGPTIENGATLLTRLALPWLMEMSLKP